MNLFSNPKTVRPRKARPIRRLKSWKILAKRRSHQRFQRWMQKIEWQFKTRPHPILWGLALSFTAGVLLLLGNPDFGNQWLPRGEQSIPLTLPSSALSEVRPQSRAINRRVVIRAGDSFKGLLGQLGIPISEQAKLLVYRSSLLPRGPAGEMFSGRMLTADFNEEGVWLSLDIDTSRKTMVRLIKQGAGIREEAWNKAETWVEKLGGGVINLSLFATLDQQNIPDNVALQVADIFGTSIDFNREIRRNDEIWVVYRQLMVDGVLQSDVHVEAVQLVNRQNTHWAFYFPATDNAQRFNRSAMLLDISKGGKVNPMSLINENQALRFFNREGKSLVQGFLRNPLEFSRVSSGFNLSRFHPILHKMRAHTGVDFSAPIGTAVRAVGDGVVRFIGEQGGYGNMIILTHANNIETRYAHLNGFAKALKRGDHVVQTQTIGYVGKTGLATGPHLHYEFRVAGRPHDPLSVNLPHGASIKTEDRARFETLRDQLLTKLDLAHVFARVSLD